MSRRRGRATVPSQRALARSLLIVKPHLRGKAGLITLGLVALLADVVFRVLEPWPLKFVVDSVSASLGATAGAAAGIPEATVGLLVACASLLVGLIALRALAAYVSTVAFALVGSRVATELRGRVFAHLQSLSPRYHAATSSGDVVQRLVGDIGRLQEVAVTAGLPLVGNIVTLVVLTVVMSLMDPLLTLVVVLAAVAYLITSRRSSRKITAASRTTRKGEGALADTAAETFGAIRVVQAYGLEERFGGGFARGNDKALTEGVRSRRLAAGLERRTDLIVGVATALVLFGGGWQVLSGSMTPGDLVVFVAYLKLAMRPLRDLAKFTGRIARAAASGERVADLLDEPVEIADAPHAAPLPRLRGEVWFDRIDLDDGRGRALARDLTLRIPAGQHICMLGPSGAGKSTLAGLLVRTADPVAGHVRLDGVSVTQATVASVRSAVSLLLQESVLFADTVRENIRLGRLDATDEEVERAARRAMAHEFVSALPQGYDTVLGNRGDTLSGGQRQRIAIARALLRDAPVVVLDEATTGLDPQSRAQVSASLAELAEGRTVISITHDVTQALAADRVVWLEDGRIVEDGEPGELMARSSSRLRRWVERARSTETPVAVGPGADR
ncbi:ABC transporter ATP-binding protein [Microbacterium oleivorans]|uniref:ABC transporter ATP-binding protein n=1 Tax=Microbacterium oleivorans TaxID=273677 RepID=A0A7D5IPD3_9MICO|nr:ABC transporter ATP-binding protein [Microbacterium oleivorans]QLD11519.1 ABC transporter ATP-binding protein [Microbacterium oleivorans]